MDDSKDSRSRVHLLREDVSRRIAAGEVIDRPLSITRELIDNSIDAGARSIDLSINGGGITEVRVRDDGAGMDRRDLELSVQAHATSKISEIGDLATTRTLGFRGEALYSIGAVSKLEISSKTQDESSIGHRVVIHAGEFVSLSETALPAGTSVTVRDLFYSLPARRKFLKRPSTESTRCVEMSVEKSLPFPGVGMQISVDGTLRRSLPVCETRRERIESAFHSTLGRVPLYDGIIDHDGLGVETVVTDPSFSRGDRRLVQIFVNNRRIDEFPLVQAALYAFEPFLPGARYPAIFVFVDIDPAEIDVNMHPAKREIRFRNRNAVHRAVVESIQEATKRLTFRAPRIDTGGDTHLFPDSTNSRREHVSESPVERFSPSNRRARESDGTAILDLSSVKEFDTWRSEGDVEPGSKDSDELERNTGTIIFHGQIFSLFLLVERSDTLFIIDQHAAHERILFDIFRSTDRSSQQLLVPRKLDVSVEKDLLAQLAESLDRVGVTIEMRNDSWYLVALPSAYHSMERVVVEFIEEFRGAEENLERELFATTACRTAVKDSDFLDKVTARELAEQALKLPEPRCPHGRPVWIELSRQELFSLVGRT